MTGKIHNLSFKGKYPSYHAYLSGKCINIYSTVTIKAGDRIKTSTLGDLFTLGTTFELNGLPKKTDKKGVFYYEFTYS